MNGTKRTWLALCRDLAAGRGTPTAVRAYTLAFTLLVTAVLALLVSSLKLALEPQRVQNERQAEERVLLSLFALEESGAAAFETFVVTHEVRSPQAAQPYIYYSRQSAPDRCVIPMAGRGFWGPIHGFLALDLTRGEITGIAFTEHEETPGLGGRINEEGFCRQFVGKPLLPAPGDGRFVRLVQSRGPDAAREVDAITGATGTSVGVEALVNSAIARFLELRRIEETP